MAGGAHWLLKSTLTCLPISKPGCNPALHMPPLTSSSLSPQCWHWCYYNLPCCVPLRGLGWLNCRNLECSIHKQLIIPAPKHIRGKLCEIYTLCPRWRNHSQTFSGLWPKRNTPCPDTHSVSGTWSSQRHAILTSEQAEQKQGAKENMPIPQLGVDKWLNCGQRDTR